MGLGHDLYQGDTRFDFPRLWKKGLIVSLVLVVISVASLATRELNLGIDFEGGTVWELPSNGTSVTAVREALVPVGAGGAKIQTVGRDGETLRVSSDIEVESVTNDESAQITATLVETSGVDEGEIAVVRTAGTWEIPVGETDIGAIEEALEPLGFSQALVTQDGDIVRVQVQSAVVAVTEALTEVTGGDVADVSVSSVGPSWGNEITRQAIRALIYFFIAIALYISLRLEWRMAIGALVAVVHDIIVTVGVYSIFQFEVTPGTVIAILTILGYSLYDTIVVYDKARENGVRLMASGRMTYTEMMSLSLNQVFMRSLNTTISGVFPVLSILLVGSVLFGAVTLQEFGIALLVGLIIGAYSSIFIAAPVVAWLKEKEPRNRQIRARLEASRQATGSPVAGDTGEAKATVGAPAAGTGTGVDRPPGWQQSHPPRPRKKTKKK